MKTSEQQEIFNNWLENHRGVLFKIVRAYACSATQQDDLFQEIAIQLWKSVPKFRGKCKESTWIYRVALFSATTWKRNDAKHRKGRQEFEETKHALVQSPTAGNSRLDWLYEQIHRFDEPDRSITLLMLDRYSYREIAEIVGLSSNAVGVRINRIKNRLVQAREEENHLHGP